MLESDYQARLVRTLELIFPGCHVIKMCTDFQSGIPDLLVLHRDRWAFLEVKPRMPRSSNDYEANQEWYIDQFNDMSFAAMICPENEEEVLDALQHSLAPRRQARVPKRL